MIRFHFCEIAHAWCLAITSWLRSTCLVQSLLIAGTDRVQSPCTMVLAYICCFMLLRNPPGEAEKDLVPSGNFTKNMERSSIFNGKTHSFDWAMFNSYVP